MREAKLLILQIEMTGKLLRTRGKHITTNSQYDMDVKGEQCPTESLYLYKVTYFI